MSFLKDFYATHVQCFIGGWCAAHMYYKECSDKHSTIWHGYEHRIKTLEAMKKYESRGFKFTSKDTSKPIMRSLKDENSLLLDYGDLYHAVLRKSHHGLLHDWLVDRRNNINGIAWTEFNGHIIAMQDVLETCYRTQKETFALHGAKLQLNQLRRLANLVALNVESNNVLCSQKFRSTISDSLQQNTSHLSELARSGTIYCGLKDATPWSWAI